MRAALDRTSLHITATCSLNEIASTGQYILHRISCETAITMLWSDIAYPYWNGNIISKKCGIAFTFLTRRHSVFVYAEYFLLCTSNWWLKGGISRNLNNNRIQISEGLETNVGFFVTIINLWKRQSKKFLWCRYKIMCIFAIRFVNLKHIR